MSEGNKINFLIYFLYFLCTLRLNLMLYSESIVDIYEILSRPTWNVNCLEHKGLV